MHYNPLCDIHCAHLCYDATSEVFTLEINICEREFPFRKIGDESERKGYYFSQDIDLSAGRQK